MGGTTNTASASPGGALITPGGLGMSMLKIINPDVYDRITGGNTTPTPMNPPTTQGKAGAPKSAAEPGVMNQQMNAFNQQQAQIRSQVLGTPVQKPEPTNYYKAPYNYVPTPKPTPIAPTGAPTATQSKTDNFHNISSKLMQNPLTNAGQYSKIQQQNNAQQKLTSIDDQSKWS